MAASDVVEGKPGFLMYVQFSLNVPDVEIEKKQQTPKLSKKILFKIRCTVRLEPEHLWLIS